MRSSICLCLRGLLLVSLAACSTQPSSPSEAPEGGSLGSSSTARPSSSTDRQAGGGTFRTTAGSASSGNGSTEPGNSSAKGGTGNASGSGSNSSSGGTELSQSSDTRSSGGGKASSATASTQTTGGAKSGSKSSSSKTTAQVGGASTGGTGNSSTASGGASSSTTTKAGTSATFPKFILGADISSVDEAIDGGTRYADVDGKTASIFDVLKNHGFNFIRLRAFVDPGAQYGYAYGTGGNCVKTETYCDTDHTVAFAKQVKAAGMGLLLDLHYSDNWCDPGNQIIPDAWRNVTSIADLASRVKAYTTDIVSKLSAAGATPEIVQIGNEITPGMLMHVPNSNTDCWGNNVSAAPIGGSTANWTNLGTLLKAGIEGVKAVDSSIRTMVHVENTKSASGVVDWVKKAIAQGVTMDIVGLSCYVAFQGQPSVWKNTFSTLATTFPELSFVIAEYNPERTQANQIMLDLPDGRGLGTFFWEPTQSGEWGESLFTWSGNTAQANAADFKEFDSIAVSAGLK